MDNRIKLFQDYYGTMSFLKNNKGVELLIFLIDDDRFYLIILIKVFNIFKVLFPFSI